MASQSTNTPDQQLEKRDGQKTVKKWVISSIIVFLLCLIAILLFNKRYVTLYYLNIMHNHYKVNDKLYAKSWLVNDTSTEGSINVRLFRKVRPINADDINAMRVDLSQKVLLKQNVNPSDKPFVTETNWVISSDTLCKYKTAWVGDYIGADIVKFKGRTDYYDIICFAINPNKRALLKEDNDNAGIYSLPAGYTWDDGPFYVLTLNVTDHDAKTFKVQKK